MTAARPTTRRRSACLALAAAVASAVLLTGSPAAAAADDGLPPVLPGTTVWSADGTAESTSGLHDGWFGGVYSDGFTGKQGDQAFAFSGWWGDAFYADAEVAQFGTSPFALSFRMRTTQTGTYSLAGTRDDNCWGTGSGWFDVRASEAAIGFELGPSIGVRVPVNVSDGEWHTIDIRRTDAGIRMTVDGTETAFRATPPVEVRSNAPFSVSDSPCIFQDGTQPYRGLLDDVRLGSLDVTAPVLTVPPGMTVDATGPAGGSATWSATATDNYDAAPLVRCDPTSGSTFLIGTTTVTCTATDSSGNIATESFPVTVRGAVVQADRLVSALSELDQGSLAVKARQALASLNRGSLESARGQLSALMNSTSAAVRAGRMTDSQGQALTVAAQRILAVLG